MGHDMMRGMHYGIRGWNRMESDGSEWDTTEKDGM